jgi:long-chain acyl-CoA synthetase
VLVDALFGGKASQFIRTQVRFEDGRTGNIEADVKIRDAATYSAAALRISA